jgi:hypothetical protein
MISDFGGLIDLFMMAFIFVCTKFNEV